jgi:tetratricopeptide (TPR) repeat protein
MIRRTFVDLAVAGLIVTLLGAGCSVHFEPGPLYPEMDSAELPEDPLSLLSISHAAYSPYGPVSSVRLSLAASEKVLSEHPQNELAAFYCSRAVTWLLEFDEALSPDEVKEMAEQGFERLRTAAERNADRVDYVFLAGALLGNAIRFSKVQGMAQVRRVHDYFQRAVDLDPTYDAGAPLRALGTLLVKAPPWPAGVGDVDGGIETLEKAVRSFPEHPANHLYLADALAAEGRKDEAAAAYRRVIDLCTDERWGAVCDIYDSRARTFLQPLQ